MRSFTYRNGALHAEDVALATIAEAVGTPFYCYSSAAIAGSFKEFRDAFAGQKALMLVGFVLAGLGGALGSGGGSNGPYLPQAASISASRAASAFRRVGLTKRYKDGAAKSDSNGRGHYTETTGRGEAALGINETGPVRRESPP